MRRALGLLLVVCACTPAKAATQITSELTATYEEVPGISYVIVTEVEAPKADCRQRTVEIHRWNDDLYDFVGQTKDGTFEFSGDPGNTSFIIVAPRKKTDRFVCLPDVTTVGT